MHVALLGAGRLGRTLAVLLPRHGIRATLLGRGDAVPVDVDALWVTVRDGEVAGVGAALPPGLCALHASGALPDDALGGHLRAGVLHPLQSFAGPELELPPLDGVHARVGGHPDARAVAEALCGRLGMTPVDVPDPARWHAAAVLASGHLAAAWLTAVDAMVAGGIPEATARRALLPLSVQSLRAASERGPWALTGPAARGDTATEAVHRASLDGDAAEVYGLLSGVLRHRLRRG
ncbi:MAG: hypothetical protein RLZZ299_871 [Pseudomonadota bacterium]